jgi:hypothetical protein
MRVFTKVNGNLLVWDVENMTHTEAIAAVRDELGVGHKPVILALVKY